MRFERGADSDSVGPAGNQVELAGRSQVNVIRSGNAVVDRIALDDHWEGEGFPTGARISTIGNATTGLAQRAVLGDQGVVPADAGHRSDAR
jgi:hypothetical protein